jgi:hypothetical protein
MPISPILFEAKHWSEVPALIAQYNNIVGENGATNFFVYGSLIKNHNDVKPESSRSSPEQGGIQNQQARLNGAVIAFNVLANGDYAFRATCGTYFDDQGVERYFANIGAYAGLEQSADGFVDGLNITVNAQDRSKAWGAYIIRELTEPPAGITFNNLIDGTDLQKLDAIKGTPSDKLGMYKLQIVNTEVEMAEGKKLVPAITVATNEDSPREFINRTPTQTANLILDGWGYRRDNGSGGFIGGTALDYFESVLKSRRELGFNDQKLEKIATAVENLATFYKEWDAVIKSKLTGIEFTRVAEEIQIRHRDCKYFYSPLVDEKEKREPVRAEDKGREENRFAHTAEEKAMRIVSLLERGSIRELRP